MNIILIGPNGSGKGTQGSIIIKKLKLNHIETGAILRKQITDSTVLGMKASQYINKGELVPDEIIIPMVLEALKESKKQGWLLDGFPRSLLQAKKLEIALYNSGMKIDYVIEIQLDRYIAKLRIQGRRICAVNNHHPNHLAYDAIKPIKKENQLYCRVCEGSLIIRADDYNEAGIDKRLDIYYEKEKGTMAAVKYYKDKNNIKLISIDGSLSIREVSKKILNQLQYNT